MRILRFQDWIEQLVCYAFKSGKSVMMDSTELPSSLTRVVDGSEEPAGTHNKLISQRERCFSPLDVEMID